ncbi:MAG: hypothetical protein JWR26_852 [Pedosphaera sp.]|nr:hypothetical protein [Pedosphaera sp.]
MSLLNSISDGLLEDKEPLEETFLSFLHSLDYPEGSLFRGPSFQLSEAAKWRNNFFRRLRNGFGSDALDEPFPCYADLAILDLETHRYVCLIEFRLQIDEQIEHSLASAFQSILTYLQTRPPVFLVVPAPGAGFQIFQLRENAVWQELPRKLFPHYPTLAAGLAAEEHLAMEVRRARSLDRFRITCHTLAAAIALTTLTNISGLSSLTIIQACLLLLAAMFVIAPHAVGVRLSPSGTKPRVLKIK